MGATRMSCRGEGSKTHSHNDREEQLRRMSRCYENELQRRGKEVRRWRVLFTGATPEALCLEEMLLSCILVLALPISGHCVTMRMPVSRTGGMCCCQYFVA